MEKFALEVVESKVWLAESKCENLKDAQTQLLEYVNALEERLESLRSSTSPLIIENKTMERLQLLHNRLIKVESSLVKSLNRLRTIQKTLTEKPVNSAGTENTN